MMQVALAIEKCLLVTTEVGLTAELPPLPLLADLKPVNDNPPPVYTSMVSAAPVC